MFGTPSPHGKFSKGGLADTPWNEDLLWKFQINQEHNQLRAFDRQNKDHKYRDPRIYFDETGALLSGDWVDTFDVSSDSSRGTTPSLKDAPSKNNRLPKLDSLLTLSKDQLRRRGSRPPSNHSRCSSESTMSSSDSRMAQASSLNDRQMQVLMKQIRKHAQALNSATQAELTSLKQAIGTETARRKAAETRTKHLMQELAEVKKRNAPKPKFKYVF